MADHGFAFLLRATVVIFTFVVAVMLYAAWAFRARRGDGDSPAPVRDHPGFSWTWLVLSLVLNIVFIFYPGVWGLRHMLGSPRPDDLVVWVKAEQWSWVFTYPDYGVTVEDRLVLPAGRRIRLEITSEDVIHSFWVPAFRLKKDAVPGRTTTLFVTPTEPISSRDDLNARVQCAELCGLGHATMRAVLQVLEPEVFEEWAARQRGG